MTTRAIAQQAAETRQTIGSRVNPAAQKKAVDEFESSKNKLSRYLSTMATEFAKHSLQSPELAGIIHSTMDSALAEMTAKTA